MQRTQTNRRQFLKRSAGTAAAAGAWPLFLPGVNARGAEKNDRPTVASIGVGGRGSGIGRDAGRRGNMVACCDVDANHADRFASRHDGKCKTYKDYRKLLERDDIDIVTIGTPDHWHTAIAIAALRAGKDIYCEKPLTLTIDEGKQIRKVLAETNRVFQVGTQQRSDRRFIRAVAIARRGWLGKTLTATCSIGAGPHGGPFEVTESPSHLDWDVWLGQTPKVPYIKQRCHNNFRWWLEYSGGKLTDWGAHHVDSAQWGLGYDKAGPISVEGEGEFPKVENGYNTATTFSSTLAFENGSKIIVRHGPGNGVLFKGDKGELFVKRGKIEGEILSQLTDAQKEQIDEDIVKLYKGRKRTNHMQNFFDCVRERAEPVSDVASHHRILSSCHMCNIAMRLGRKLRWDPKKEDFIGDEQASAMLRRKQRKPYALAV